MYNGYYNDHMTLKPSDSIELVVKLVINLFDISSPRHYRIRLCITHFFVHQNHLTSLNEYKSIARLLQLITEQPMEKLSLPHSPVCSTHFLLIKII